MVDHIDGHPVRSGHEPSLSAWRLSPGTIASRALILASLLAVSLTPAAASGRPLTEGDILKLLHGGVFMQRLAKLVLERGIAFVPTDTDLAHLRRAGADDAVLDAVLKMTKPADAVEVAPATPKQDLKTQGAVAKAASHDMTFAAPAALKLALQKVLATDPKPGHEDRGEVYPQAASLEAGAEITLSNWRQFRQYMPFGMTQLFERRRFWKMPLNVVMRLGPTTLERLPAGYTEATKRYSSQVRVVHLQDGHNDIANYRGGEPFPNPQEPDKGYKLLADLWFAYVPHIVAGTSANPLRTCSQDSVGNIKCLKVLYVYRQLAYNTDPGVPTEEPNAKDLWYSEWSQVEEPEQARYTAQLTLFYKDNQRPEESYTYIPQLRTSFRGSLASHCSPVVGTDYVQDDYKGTGFNGGIARFDAEFVRHQKIVALIGDYKPLAGSFPRDYYMPLGWPSPSWATWQLRDVDVIAVRPVHPEKWGYCYPVRMIYEDSHTHYALWEDAYDTHMKLWKSAFVAQRFVNASVVGYVPGGVTSTVWDFENSHMTNVSTEDENGDDLLADFDVPQMYTDLAVYVSPAGLHQSLK